MKKNAEKQYLQDQTVNSRNDIRKFWTIIKSLTSQKPKFSSPNCINTANGSPTRMQSLKNLAITFLELVKSFKVDVSN